MSVTRSEAGPGRRVLPECRTTIRRAWVGAAVGVWMALVLPASASAHGAINPVATDYIAGIGHVPVGLHAHVVDGDLRMWLQVPRDATVVVLDYRGVPYLRFSAAGVQVNTNSEMDYLNQSPPVVPPLVLPHAIRWATATRGHEYEWHDGRLQALASVAVAGSTRYVGRWQIPLRVDGQLVYLSGPVFHHSPPSLLWFWPILVLIGCVLAAWRVHDPGLDHRLANLLGVVALVALSLIAIGRELHGRPGVGVLQVIELVAVLALTIAALVRILRGRAGYVLLLMIGAATLYAGILTLPTLTHGYVLMALPPFIIRIAAVLCLGSIPSLVVMVARLFDTESGGDDESPEPELVEDDVENLVQPGA